MDTPTINQIITTERRHHAWRNFWAFVALAFLFGGAAITLLTERDALVLPILTEYPGAPMITGWVIALLIMAISFPLTRPPEGAEASAVLQRQIETYQGRYRAWLLMLAGIAVIYTVLETVFPGALPGWFAPPHYAMNWFGTLYVIAVLQAILSSRRRPYLEIPGGIDFNDELVRAVRLRAARLGFIAVMLALAGTYLWILYYPLDARLILPWILAGGVTVPAVGFAVMHARAGREA